MLASAKIITLIQGADLRTKGQKQMELTENQVLAIKRKRGELDLSITQLANATGVSKWTLIDIFKHDHRNVTTATFTKLNNWLINQYELASNLGATLNEWIQI